MRRIVAVVFAAALVLLTLQSPAEAKGPDRATISGPGIGTTQLRMEDSSGLTLQKLLRITRFWDGAGVAAWDIDRPGGDLGPRFVVTYHVPHGGNDPLIRQELYPFAEAGPVVHMPEGQSMYGMDMAYGWLATDQRLVRVVERLGGTSTPPGSRIEPAAHEASTSGGGGGPGWAVLAGGAAGAVLLATAVGWRRRASRLA